MMTVARRNRVWTKELKATLVKQINEKKAAGLRIGKACEELSPMWGVTGWSLQMRYYDILAERNTKATVTQMMDGQKDYKLVSVSVKPSKVASIILALNKAGVAARKINVTF